MSDITIRKACRQVLKKNNSPMKVKKLLEEVKKIRSFEGQTPYNTLISILQRGDEFRKVNPATYEYIDK